MSTHIVLQFMNFLPVHTSFYVAMFVTSKKDGAKIKLKNDFIYIYEVCSFIAAIAFMNYVDSK